jgi:hypothetical protein
MSGERADRGDVLALNEDKPDWGDKKTAEMRPQAAQKTDREFTKTIVDAIAVVEAEWKAQRERDLAERNRLENAHQKAIMVREIMILPMLNNLRAGFETDKEKVLPNWQIQSGGDADAVWGVAETPAVDDGGPSCFIVKAGASVADQGAALNLTVHCSCVDAQNLSTGKPRQIYEKTKAATMVKFDDLASEMWFHEHIKECVRMCVLTRMRHTPRHDAGGLPQAALRGFAIPLSMAGETSSAAVSPAH